MDSKLRCVFELPPDCQLPPTIETVAVPQDYREGSKSLPKVGIFGFSILSLECMEWLITLFGCKFMFNSFQ